LFSLKKVNQAINKALLNPTFNASSPSPTYRASRWR
jgi:hypothetical protein